MSALSMGLTNGPVKADAIICDKKPYIYEVTPRFHGDILTSGVMGFLKEKNPIMQLLTLIKTGNANLLEDIDNPHYVSGWRMICKYTPFAFLACYCIARQSSKYLHRLTVSVYASNYFTRSN